VSNVNDRLSGNMSDENSVGQLPQSDYLSLVKFARYTALTVDKLAGEVLSLAAKLEDLGILEVHRQSRFERDMKVRKHLSDALGHDQEVSKMVKLIPDHPDAELLIENLFRDLQTPRFKQDLKVLPEASGASESIEKS
jgi:hypothetical protein